MTNTPIEAEAREIFNLFLKLANFLKDLFSSKDFKRKKFRSILSTIILSKCLSHNTWIELTRSNSKYSFTVEVLGNDEIFIIVGSIEAYNDDHTVMALVVGDSENNLLFFGEDV